MAQQPAPEYALVDARSKEQQENTGMRLPHNAAHDQRLEVRVSYNPTHVALFVTLSYMCTLVVV
jgi:hypothetical protein